MVQSLNTKVDLTVKATSYLGLANYGEVMVGDKAFEFYNEKNIRDYIQIPWEEVNCVMASVMFKGKWIPRFAVVTKNNGNLLSHHAIIKHYYVLLINIFPQKI